MRGGSRVEREREAERERWRGNHGRNTERYGHGTCTPSTPLLRCAAVACFVRAVCACLCLSSPLACVFVLVPFFFYEKRWESGFSFEFGGGHTPLPLSCCTTLLFLLENCYEKTATKQA